MNAMARYDVVKRDIFADAPVLTDGRRDGDRGSIQESNRETSRNSTLENESPGSLESSIGSTRKMISESSRQVNCAINLADSWEGPAWKEIEAIPVKNMMGDTPLFVPGTQVKMMYDESHLYVLFLVKDRYVRCRITECNGPVYEESAVEFFFSPDPEFPDRYFNLEINGGGTPLMRYNDFRLQEHRFLKVEDIQKVDIAHSLPRVVDPEVAMPVTWTVECKIPLEMIESYAKVVRPQPGVEWRANFYKIAEKGTNVHFLTWSEVVNPVPNFHLPAFFGTLRFV